MPKTLHVSMTKEFLRSFVATRDDWREVLPGFDGTRADALRAIMDDERDYFVGDIECDNQKPDGSCAGHPFSGKDEVTP